MIKLLVVNTFGGVHYHRLETPHKNLSKNFFVEFIDWKKETDIEILKNYDGIVFSKVVFDEQTNKKIFEYCKKHNIKIIVDIDDYWELPTTHPNYLMTKNSNVISLIQYSLKNADLITTTNEYLNNYLLRLNKNSHVLENAINPEEKQFEIQNKQSEKVSVGWLGGSSHLEDLKKFIKLFPQLKADNLNFKTILCGFDLNSVATTLDFMIDELANDLKYLNLYSKDIYIEVQKCRGDLSKSVLLPKQIKDKYNKIYQPKKTSRKMQPNETVWYAYELIFTDNYSMIEDKNYLNFLNKFEDKKYFDAENQIYERFFTRPVNEYAKNYNNMDIVLAPLTNNIFNNCKSNLKQIEAGFFKKAIICSDSRVYSEIGLNGENCFLVGEHKERNWHKYLKRLITDKNLREDMGNKLYETVSKKYHINTVNLKREEIYSKIFK